MNLDDFGRPSFCHGLSPDLAVVDDPQSRLLPNAVSVGRSKVSVVSLKKQVETFSFRTFNRSEDTKYANFKIQV